MLAGSSTESDSARRQTGCCLPHRRSHTRREREIQSHYSYNFVSEISIAQQVVVHIRISTKKFYHYCCECITKFDMYIDILIIAVLIITSDIYRQSHPDAQATYITAMPDCHMPFHWPRLDKDQLLCVRILDVPNCMWSGGITLDGNHSLTINIRDSASKMHFLRVDVVLQESTYFIVFTDAETMPPPIRVDNFSEVPLTINQVC